MREEIGPDDLFLTGDFGTLPIQQGSQRTLPDLVLVAHMRDSNGDLAHCYLDCIPLVDQHESKDWNYVRSVMWDLHRSGFMTGYKRLIWWSDTGPAHFRTSNTLFFWRDFQCVTGIEVCIFFFAPHHGHNMCDGHLGAISRRMTKNAQSLDDALVGWDREWVVDQMSSLSSTCIYFNKIERVPKIVETLAGIREYLVFSFDNDVCDSVTCGTMCGDSSPVTLRFQKLDQTELIALAAQEKAEAALLEQIFRQAVCEDF